MKFIDALIRGLHDQFPVDPVPPYPPMMGMDPLGVDEYASFSDRRWTEVPPRSYNHNPYDISPANGFSSFDPPHLWNYHLPGFLSASLLHESECDTLDGFMFFFKRVTPEKSKQRSTGMPWWSGNVFSGNYTDEQCDVVLAFL